MSGSYSASASLTVRSNAPAVLSSIARGLGMVDGRIKRTEQELGKLLAQFSGLRAAQTSVANMDRTMQGLQTNARGVATAVRTVARAMDATGRGADVAAVALDRTSNAMTRAAGAAAQVAAQAGRATAAMRNLGAVRPMQAPRAGGGGAGSRDSRLGEAVSAGAAGRGILGGLFVAGSLQHEEAVLRAQTRPGDARFRERVMSRAVEMTGLVRGTTVQSNYALINELRTVLGGQEEALHFAPQFAEIAGALHALTGRSPDDVVGGLGRAMTLRGSFVDPRTGEFDSARGAREVEQAARMLMAFRDRRMDPNAMLLYQRQARVAGAQLTPEAYFGGFVASGIQAMGGPRFGTGHAAFYRQMVTGIMTNAQAEQMKRFGLMAPNARGARLSEADIRRLEADGTIDAETAAAMRQGGASRFGRRAIRGADLAAVDPDAWRQLVTPELDARLRQMLGREPTHQDRVAAQASLGGTEVARGWLQWLFNPAERQPDIEAVRSVQPGAPGQLLNESFNVALQNMTSGFTNLITAIGQAATPDIIAAMDSLASAFNKMAQWAREDPETARVVGGLATALGLLAVGGAAFAAGTLALGGLTALTGALTGLSAAAVVGGLAFITSPLGLALLGGSIVALAATMEGKDWAALFKSLRDGVSSLWDWLKRITGFGGSDAPASPVPGSPAPSGQPDFGAGPGLRFAPVPGTLSPRPGILGGGYRFQNFEPPPAAAPQTIPIILHMDGRRVGEGVMPYFERALSGPTASAARFDPRRALPAFDQS